MRRIISFAGDHVNRTRLLYLGQEYGIALLIFFALSIAVTWPLAGNFSSSLIGGGADAKHHLWILWHVKEVVLGNESLFFAQGLYYPKGISLLTHSMGPVLGIITLPFWVLGATAVYNAAVLTGCWLTGFFMYLFARSLGFSRDVSVLTGIVLLMAPIHLTAISAGHLARIFLGLIPLTLLAVNHALDPKKSRWWVALTAVFLLLTLLHSGRHFVLTIIGVGFLTLIWLLTTERQARPQVFWRGVLVVFCTILLTGGLLLAILAASNGMGIDVDKNIESFDFQPDLLHFFIPRPFPSYFWGSLFKDFFKTFEQSAAQHETSVFLSWTSIILCVFALISRKKEAYRWFAFTAIIVIFALGPVLLIMGESQFTEYDLPIILPYAFLTMLPGMDFLRTPGRFMMVGFVGLAVTAAYGLVWLKMKLPISLGTAVVLLAIGLILFENWPKPWKVQPLPPVPEFYIQLAHDQDMYGVFDLPIRPLAEQRFESWYVSFSTNYQMEQMTHRKGIASGYISRTYSPHPIFGHVITENVTEFPLQENVLVNGEIANRYENMLYELAENNFRYVVFHKPEIGFDYYKADSWGEQTAKTFITEVFGDQAPFEDDDLVTVYEVPSRPPVTDLKTNIALIDGSTWFESPVLLHVTSPTAQIADVGIRVDAVQDREVNELLDSVGMTVHMGNQSLSTQIQPGVLVTIPLMLEPGIHTMTLQFHTTEDAPDAQEPDPINVSIGLLNLDTENSKWRQHTTIVDDSVHVTYGSGWYLPEIWDDSGLPWRWAESPAKLWVYSPTNRRITLSTAVGALHVAETEKGLGNVGAMRVTVNHQPSQEFSVNPGEPLVINTVLEEGWNEIVLDLAAGNFRPSDLDANSGDLRWLSFALQEFRTSLE